MCIGVGAPTGVLSDAPGIGVTVLVSCLIWMLPTKLRPYVKAANTLMHLPIASSPRCLFKLFITLQILKLKTTNKTLSGKEIYG